MSQLFNILDVSVDEVRSDIVPLYAKADISDKELIKVVNEQLAGVSTLPLDFLQLVKVVRTGQYEGVFGVLKNEYDVSYSIQDSDKRSTRKPANETITFFECIYTGYGDIPDDIIESIKMPSETNWVEKGLKKIGYITQQKAEFMANDIMMGRSSADTVKDKLKAILSDYGRYEGTWHYVNESVVVKKVRSVSKPRYIQLTIRFFEWEYKGQTGICYYLPTSETVVSKDLPEDAIIKAELKKADVWESIAFSLSTVIIIAAIVLAIYLGFHGVKWYKCLLWGFVFVIVGYIPGYIGLSLKSGKEIKNKYTRLEQSKLHF